MSQAGSRRSRARAPPGRAPDSVARQETSVLDLSDREEGVTYSGKRADKTAASVKALAREAWALHKAGKHDEAVTKYEEAPKKGRLALKHAQ